MLRPMIPRTALALAAAAAASLAADGATAAPPQPLSSFDVTKLDGWPDALAVCDITAFLRTRPDIDADVILARDENSGWFRPLYRPRFLPPTLFFDSDIRRAFERLEKAGEIDRRSVNEARARWDRPMLRSYDRSGVRERIFLDDQGKVCDALVADVRARYR